MGERGERLLFVRAMLWLAATDLALRVFGFQRLVRWAQRERRGASAALDAEPMTRARRCAHAIEVIATYRSLRVRCLRRSLALHLWLRRHGLASELRIGVRREFHALQAHAWVELGGEVLNDHPLALAAFVPLYSSAPERPGGHAELAGSQVLGDSSSASLGLPLPHPGPLSFDAVGVGREREGDRAAHDSDGFICHRGLGSTT